jgi:hypothetical protein
MIQSIISIFFKRLLHIQEFKLQEGWFDRLSRYCQWFDADELCSFFGYAAAPSLSLHRRSRGEGLVLCLQIPLQYREGFAIKHVQSQK